VRGFSADFVGEDPYSKSFSVKFSLTKAKRRFENTARFSTNLSSRRYHDPAISSELQTVRD